MPFNRFHRKITASMTHVRKDETMILVFRNYREIQLISKLFQDLFADVLVTYLFACVATQIISVLHLFKMIRGSPVGQEPENSWIGLVFYLMIALDSTVMVNALYGFCGQVHHESCRCVLQMRVMVQSNVQTFRKFRKHVRSLSTVKVEFGRTGNFVDKRTPFIYQQFTVQRLIDILLVTYRQHF